MQLCVHDDDILISVFFFFFKVKGAAVFPTCEKKMGGDLCTSPEAQISDSYSGKLGLNIY